ncbi:galactose oxidase-like domain-containing protein, partial [Pseudarthrobacter siccitolerans]|uniref:galactose oxidase-like domain-containing protein n=1 Tax=Pseudarthrobacter siccitolerans TaxID=861266 RepID=UPI00128E54CD
MVSAFELLPAQLEMSGTHAAVTPKGDVLYFSYDPAAENEVGTCKWQLWNLERGTFGPSGDVHRNIFCAGHSWLSNGLLLVGGGQSWNWAGPGVGADHDVHTFDPATATWTKHRPMPWARYYPTCVALPQGDGLIVGGAANRYFPTFTNVPNDKAEVFSIADNQAGKPFQFNPGHIVDMYPFLHVVPSAAAKNGLLWVFSRNACRLWDIETRTWLSPHWKMALAGRRSYPHQGTSVLLPLHHNAPQDVRILTVGGAGETSLYPVPHEKILASAECEIFEINTNDPTKSTWRSPKGGSLSHARFMCDATLLANGKVLVTGGAGGGVADHSHHPVLGAELFNPETETWAPAGNLNRSRMYHSTAVLLPSGAVAVAGNTEHWNPANPVEDSSIEIYRPDYMAAGDRPRITAATSKSLGLGSTNVEITVESTAEIERVALVRCSSATHSINSDQRYVTLDFRRQGHSKLQLLMPGSASVAPPGPYMLFLLDLRGTASEAVMVTVRHAEPTGPRWIGLPGSASDIGVGANGTAWVIGTDPTPGGHGIHYWTGNGWQGIDGGAERIAVDNQGLPWVVNNAGKIFRREGNLWIGLPGSARDIGV